MLKKIAGIGMNVLNSFNDIYKGIKPFSEPIVGALPFGNYINKGLDAASTVIDKVQPFTNRWLNDKDKLNSSRIANGIQKFAGKATQRLLNNYLDTQDTNYSSKSNRNNIFGDILNN